MNDKNKVTVEGLRLVTKTRIYRFNGKSYFDTCREEQGKTGASFMEQTLRMIHDRKIANASVIRSHKLKR